MKKTDLEIIKKIKKYCDEINEALLGVDFSKFNSNEQIYKDKRSACSLYLFQIGELANKLTDEFKKEHSGYNWSGAYRLRNIIGHDYETISNDSLWKASRQNCNALLKHVTKIINEAEKGIPKQVEIQPYSTLKKIEKPSFNDTLSRAKQKSKEQDKQNTIPTKPKRTTPEL